jgi:DNA-binding CsgD family transcriptional regulator
VALRAGSSAAGASGAWNRTRPADTTRALLERQVELATLGEELDAARSGVGRLVAIEGAAGVGKTRLVSELSSLASAHGFTTLAARAGPRDRGFAYGVVRQLIAPSMRKDPVTERVLSGRAKAAPTGDDAGAQLGLEISHRLVRLIVGLADSGPLLLTLDDAHWADLPSLRFLSFLARRLDGLPVLAVVTRRPGTDAAERESVIVPVEHRRLSLLPLTPPATAAVLRDELGELDDRLCDACHDLTGGNPLLLHELLHAIRAKGVEPTVDAIRFVGGFGSTALSRTVNVRLGDLAPEAVRLAEAAAVVGEHLPLRYAVTVAGLDEDEARRASADLRQVEVLGVGPDISFTHPLLADALRQRADPLSANRMHEQAARLLIAEGAPPAMVATHLLDLAPAGDGTRVETLRAAATTSMSAGDPATAAAYLRRALAESAGGEEPSATSHEELLRALASAEVHVDKAAAAVHLEQLVDLAEDPVKRAPILARLAAIHVGSDPDEASRLALGAIDGLGDREPELRRQLLAVVGTSAVLSSAMVDLPESLVSAMRSESAGDGPGARMLTCALGYSDVWRNRPVAELGGLERSFGGDWLAALKLNGGPFALGVMALSAADSPVADRVVEEWVSFARRASAASHLGGAMMLRAHLALLHGRVDDARADAGECLEAMESYGCTGVEVAYGAAARANASIESGDLADAADVIERGEAVATGSGFVGLHALWFCRARLRAVMGEFAGALEETTALGRRFEELGGVSPAILPWRSEAAQIHVALGDRGAALAMASEEVDLSRTSGSARATGRALTAAALASDGSEGVVLAEEAVASLQLVPAPLEETRALLALGTALHRADKLDAARDPLRRALELASRCGASPLSERVRAALVAAGARPRRDALSGPASLTSSEARVARLAARGKTNRQIARELYLAQRTVEVHLSSTYRKLGIHSRAQLHDALRHQARSSAAGQRASRAAKPRPRSVDDFSGNPS